MDRSKKTNTLNMITIIEDNPKKNGGEFDGVKKSGLLKNGNNKRSRARLREVNPLE